MSYRTGEEQGEVVYFHTDRLGSIFASSDSDGVVTQKMSYGPWGEPSGPVDIGFTGQRYDNELELYYFKHRYYSPRHGRFLQTDPIGYTNSDLNLYTFATNNPNSYVDPLGLEPICADDVNKFQDELYQYYKNRAIKQGYDDATAGGIAHRYTMQFMTNYRDRLAQGVNGDADVAKLAGMGGMETEALNAILLKCSIRQKTELEKLLDNIKKTAEALGKQVGKNWDDFGKGFDTLKTGVEKGLTDLKNSAENGLNSLLNP